MIEEELKELQREIFNQEFSKGSQTTTGMCNLLRPFIYKGIIKFILPEIPEDSLVLDIGCGDGWIAKGITGKANKIIAIDISEEAIRRGREDNCDERIVYFLSSFEEFSYGDKFDVILAIDILEHVFNPVAFLEKVNSLLKEKGIIILRTPNVKRLTNYIKKLYRLIRLKNTRIELIESHFQEYSYLEIHWMLKKTNFSIRKELTDSLLDIKYFPKILLNLPTVRINWLLGRFTPPLASNVSIVAEKSHRAI